MQYCTSTQGKTGNTMSSGGVLGVKLNVQYKKSAKLLLLVCYRQSFGSRGDCHKCIARAPSADGDPFALFAYSLSWTVSGFEEGHKQMESGDMDALLFLVAVSGAIVRLLFRLRS